MVNVQTVNKDSWVKKDETWYAHIPFECNESDDVIINFVDPIDYIKENIESFEYIRNGYTKDNECVITAINKPECDITVELKRAAVTPGRVIYTKDSEGNFVAEWEPAETPPQNIPANFLMNALGNIATQNDLNNIMPMPLSGDYSQLVDQVIDSEGNVINPVGDIINETIDNIINDNID